jgi:MFS family permease
MVSTSNRVPRSYWLAYLTGGFGLGLNAMVQFLLPLRANDLGIGLGTIGLLLGAKAIVEAVASTPVGGLIDRVGTRRAFIIGTLTCALIGLTFTVATTVPQLFLLQVGLGLARPLGWISAQAFVAGLRKGPNQAQDTGRFSFVATAGQVLAPLMVGFGAQSFGTGPAFWFFGAYCAAFVVLGLVLPRTDPPPTTKKSQGLIQGLRLFAIDGIKVAMLLTFARLWISSTWTSFFSLHLVTSGVAEGSAATVVSTMAIIGTALSPTAGRLAQLGREDYLCAAALSCSAVGLALSPVIDSLPLAYIGAVLVGIGHGLSLPFLLVLVPRSAPEGQRGLALGLRAGVNQFAASISPVLTASVIGLASAGIGFPLAGGIGLAVLGAAAAIARRAGPAPVAERHDPS